MKLIKFIVNKKILIGLLTVLTIFLGSYSLTKLDAELMPEVELDMAYIFVNAGDMSAVEVERNFTTPLEQAVLHLDGIESVQSTTTTGATNIIVTIEQGQGEEMSQEIELVANSILADQSGIVDFTAGQFNTGSDYEFFMDISGGDMAVMTQFAEETLQPRLESLPEVHDVSLMGIQQYEMVIAFDKERLMEHGVDHSHVISILQQETMDATVGELTGEDEQLAVRFESNLHSVEDLKNVTIPTLNGIVKLDELATVSLDPIETSSNVWKEGTKDFIFVEIQRTPNVTQLQMAEAIRSEVQNIKDEGLVDTFTLNEIVAQADYVQDSLDTIKENIIIGGVIAVIILLMFLRNIRATVIIAVSIPTSILLTFLTMSLLDYSLNLMTLIALGLGIGMMIDSSIVILESIYKKKEQHGRTIDAVIEGTKEVSSAVIASVLTTIVVFIPIGLMSGEIGQIVSILFVVISITLISGLVVAFTLIPTLSNRFLKLRKRRKEGKLIKGYERFIAWVVRKKRNSLAMVGIFLVMLVGSIVLLFQIPMTIMPDLFNRYAEVGIELESDLSTQDKDEVVAEITETVQMIKDVETVHMMDEGTMLFLLINMTKEDEITREQKQVNEDIFKELRALEENLPIEGVLDIASVEQSVQINVSGEEFEELQNIAEQITIEMEEIEGIVRVSNSMEHGSIEKIVDLNEDKLEESGLSTLELRSALDDAFLGLPIGEIQMADSEAPLIVKWEYEVATEEQLLNWTLPTQQGEEKLNSFVDIRNVEVPNEISHLDGERYLTIFADLEDTDLGTVNREIQQLIKDLDVPNGYTVSAGGELETQAELMFDLLIIFVTAIFLVYLVMAVQFNHLSHPIIVMSTIPMAFIGVVIGIFITQQEMNIMTMMGIFMLFGIVLNNAILLVDRAKQLRNKRLSASEAIVQAGKDRIRPIFITTFTTVGGLIPLALESGSSGNYQAPMAIAIISGLLFATMVTLVLIPAVYRLFHAVGNGFRHIFNRTTKQTQQKTQDDVDIAN